MPSRWSASWTPTDRLSPFFIVAPSLWQLSVHLYQGMAPYGPLYSPDTGVRSPTPGTVTAVETFSKVGLSSTDLVRKPLLSVGMSLEGIKRTVGSHPDKDIPTDDSGMR